MRKIFFLFSLVTFILTSSIWAADISGTWVLKYTGKQGDDRVLDLVIKAAGENLTVNMTHPSLGEMAGTGTLKGNDIAMTITATGERKIGFEMKGTVTGDKMSGTREVTMSEEGGQGGPPGGEGGAASGSGAPPQGEQGERGAPPGGAVSGAEGGAASGARAGAPSGAPGGAPGSDSSTDKETSNAWTAEKKK